MDQPSPITEVEAPTVANRRGGGTSGRQSQSKPQTTLNQPETLNQPTFYLLNLNTARRHSQETQLWVIPGSGMTQGGAWDDPRAGGGDPGEEP